MLDTVRTLWKGLLMLALAYTLLVAGLGLGGCAIPTTGYVTPEQVAEP